MTKYAKDLSTLMQRISYQFNNPELLHKALTHRSYLNEVDFVGMEHNERLEFLGDAVLELITTSYLFHKFPDRPEGELTSFRAALVRTESLSGVSTEIGLGQYIYMSKGEESTGGRDRPYILANTFEAMLGAIYLDSGYDECERIVSELLLPKLATIIEKRLDIDAKSRLQELAQEMYKYTPKYEVTNEEGPDHEKVFTVFAIINDTKKGEGKGRSKQEAEQNAAANALEKLQRK